MSPSCQEGKIGKPGPNPTDINRSVQVGLAKTMTSKTALRTILLAGTPAPSTRSMQDSANRTDNVGKKLIKLGQQCIEDERHHLKQLNIACGYQLIPQSWQCDCRYYLMCSCGETTAFQPATQRLYCKNSTPKDYCCMKNKLSCELYSGSDSDECDTFLAKGATIGDKWAWAYECAKGPRASDNSLHHWWW